jgi:CBS domain-containing protein
MAGERAGSDPTRIDPRVRWRHGRTADFIDCRAGIARSREVSEPTTSDNNVRPCDRARAPWHGRCTAKCYMRQVEQPRSRWSRWIGGLANGAISALASVAHRVGAPTLVGVPVSAAILTRVVAVRPEQPLDEVAQIFVSGSHDLLPVVDQGEPVAVISRQDIATGLARVGPHAPVAAAPSHHVLTVMPSESLAHVLERLHEMPDAIAVVVDHGGPVGVLTEESLIAYIDEASRRAV